MDAGGDLCERRVPLPAQEDVVVSGCALKVEGFVVEGYEGGVVVYEVEGADEGEPAEVRV